MFVTCFYDIYNKPEMVERYLKLFEPLGLSGLPFHLFTSPDLVPRFSHYPQTVKVFEMPLDSLKIYTLGMNSQTELPKVRNLTKDTREYLSLMNTKAEFLYYSSLNTQDKTVIWIDFAILKLVKKMEIDEVLNYLRKINDTKFNKMNIPGCWPSRNDIIVESVIWRFCGSFLISPHELVQKFYELSKNEFTKFCYPDDSRLKITWEVNLWSEIEKNDGKDLIEWYPADHNESMFTNVKFDS